MYHNAASVVVSMLCYKLIGIFIFSFIYLFVSLADPYTYLNIPFKKSLFNLFYQLAALIFRRG